MFSLPLPRLNRSSKGHLTRNHGLRTLRQIKGRNLRYLPPEGLAWVSDALSSSHAVAPGGSTSSRPGFNALADSFGYEVRSTVLGTAATRYTTLSPSHKSSGQFYPSTRRTLKFQFSRVQSRTPHLSPRTNGPQSAANIQLMSCKFLPLSFLATRSTTTTLRLCQFHLAPFKNGILGRTGHQPKIGSPSYWDRARQNGLDTSGYNCQDSPVEAANAREDEQNRREEHLSTKTSTTGLKQERHQGAPSPARPTPPPHLHFRLIDE
ncbi:hypothetical protein BDP55DRAFT_627081 [Colletotrichum godetiae]|uniref:Uncharacterized protein n=1 Tax=Colletotrichum godetiae TaxID=1209918 RepID=A0AAJ0B0B5_9PEZI|nr:uncharacterized protein BDP55DRAFT_627081 [Colletotrichum godetiae]KAK1691414.1 hypothetical protein BDP55DRAFT_627081 [Colletotrichum godetiae]